MTPHDLLINDLATILDEASRREFHDFENTKYATPKMELVRQLEAIITNVKNGKYDD